MTNPHAAPSIDRAQRGRHDANGNGSSYLGARSRRLSWVPLSLVMLSLAGLAITPLVLQQRTRELRADVRAVAEPGRLILGDLRFGLARELSLSQRFALSRESTDWFAYHRAAARDDSLIARLDLTLQDIGPAASAAMTNLRRRLEGWRIVADVDDGRASSDIVRDALLHGINYEDLLLATSRVDSAVARAMQARRGQLDEAEQLELTLSISFVLLGCAACAAVLILTLRDRHLRIVLKRRAEEEASLRKLAASLSGAFTINEVGELTVAAALNSSRVGGAYLARAEDGYLVTVSGRGTLAPVVGTRSPIPPWLHDSTDRDQPRIFTTEVRPAPAPPNINGPSRKSGSLLLVPLCHNGDVIGALGIASAGGRRQFRESALRFGRALGDLAAVAMHRAEALESERKARAEAESAVRTRDAVVSIVSHDLRNPLMAILGSAELLLELIADDGHAVARSQLATLKHAADSMNRLVRDLLDVTRLESGPLPVARARLNVGDVVEEVVAMFQIVVRARRLKLHYEAQPKLPQILGDRDRLAQAFSNLIGNAVKFTPDGGEIAVILDTEPGWVRALVRDSGPGIEKDQIPFLFDRFWQASRQDARGLGLGLTIVKAIVEAHGGMVSVESTLKQGATFCIALPRADGERLPRPNSLANETAESIRPQVKEPQRIAPLYAGMAPPLQESQS